MEKANILVFGNSGAGKSTLINAVLDNNVAKTSIGERGTKNMDIYESDEIPFRLIDSKGMEYNLFAQLNAKHQIEKWIKINLSEDKKEKCVSMIWFCVDSMSSRLFKDNIKTLKSITREWKKIPVIVVLTKAYSETQKEENEQMVRAQIGKYGKDKINVCAIISVVAKEMPINESTIIPPMGLDMLINKTIELSPLALELAKEAVAYYQLKLKKTTANTVTATATAAAVVVGATPIPFADAAILVPVQTGMVQAISKIYGISKEDKQLISVIVECGTVSVVARTVLSGLKSVLPVAANVLNAMVAGAFTTAVGEISIYVMEQVYIGNKSAKDLDWIRKISESQFKEKMEAVLPLLEDLNGKIDVKDLKSLGKIIPKLFEKNK